MAVRIYTDTELRAIASFDVKMMKRFVPRRVREAMLLRRNLQISLAYYSKMQRRGASGLDQVQGGIIHLCRMIELWARDAFMRYYFPRRLAAAAGRVSRVQVKETLKAEWERYAKRVAY